MSVSSWWAGESDAAKTGPKDMAALFCPNAPVRRRRWERAALGYI